MIYNQTVIRTIDNPGARYVRCLKTLKKSLSTPALAGDVIVVSIIKIIPRIVYNRKKHLKKKKTIQKGEIHRALITTCKRKLVRFGWQYIGSDKSTVVVLNKQLVPWGSRILSPIFEEVRRSKFMRAVSMAPMSI